MSSAASTAALPEPVYESPPYPITDPSLRSHCYTQHRAYIQSWNDWYSANGVKSATDYVELQCRRNAKRPAMTYARDAATSVSVSGTAAEDWTHSHPITYGQWNILSNRLASYFISIDLPTRARKQQASATSSTSGTVCLLLSNSPFFLICWFALAKLGLTCALLNTSLKGGKGMKHAIEISTVKHGVGEETTSATAADTSSSSSQHTIIISESYRSEWLITEQLYRDEGREPPFVLWTKGEEIEWERILDGAAAPANSSTNPAAPTTSSPPSTITTTKPDKYALLKSQESHLLKFISSVESASSFAYIEECLTSALHIRASHESYTHHRTHIHMESPLFLIYTSGTTGPSKAGIFSHRRFIGAGLTWSYPMCLTPHDKYYICLPLYHGNAGCVAVSACVHSGCHMFIRKKFSVSSFWNDVRMYKITAMVYVGELWRYLHNAPLTSNDAQNTLRVICGNGLRTDIWSSIQTRFNIERIVEHYGMTEMPAGPYMNFYGKVGSCGYIPLEVRKKTGADKLIRYDVAEDAPVRGKDGLCEEILEPNTVGECVFLLAPSVHTTANEASTVVPSTASASSFSSSQHEQQLLLNPHTEGGRVDSHTSDIPDPLGNPLYTKPYRNYTSLQACAKRVYRSVITPLDAWFSTGDLLSYDSEGFFYFVDRAGDTFRWKGENVATNEVAEVMTQWRDDQNPTIRIKEANVYGVEWKGHDGKVGMACVVLDESGVADASTAAASASTAATSSSLASSTSHPNFHPTSLFTYLSSTLPSHALPVFLRIRHPNNGDNSKTSTLKLQKVEYVREGFDPSLCENRGDEIWVWRNGGRSKKEVEERKTKGEVQTYERMTGELYQELMGGK